MKTCEGPGQHVVFEVSDCPDQWSAQMMAELIFSRPCLLDVSIWHCFACVASRSWDLLDATAERERVWGGGKVVERGPVG